MVWESNDRLSGCVCCGKGGVSIPAVVWDTSTIKQTPPFCLHMFVLLPNLYHFFCLSCLLASKPLSLRLLGNRACFQIGPTDPWSSPFSFVPFSVSIPYKMSGFPCPIPIVLSSSSLLCPLLPSSDTATGIQRFLHYSDDIVADTIIHHSQIAYGTLSQWSTCCEMD